MLAVRRDGERLSFRVRVTAPAVEGKANAAVLELLAEALDVPHSAIHLERGAAVRTKRVSVPRGAEAALRRLAK